MIRRSTFFSVIVATALGLALFLVKYQVQDLEDQLTKIDREIVAERQTIHVLRAEWSHLNEPNRLRNLAVRHLGLVPLDSQQFLTSARFDARIHEPVEQAEISAEFTPEVNEEVNKHDRTEVQSPDFASRMRRVLNEGKKQ